MASVYQLFIKIKGLSSAYLNKGPVSASHAIADSLEDDANFVQALAQIAGIRIEMTRLYQGQNDHIEALTTMCESPEL